MTTRHRRSSKFRSVHRNTLVRRGKDCSVDIDCKGTTGRAFVRWHHEKSRAIESRQIGRYIFTDNRGITMYDERGRQKSYRESACQRRERIRRQISKRRRDPFEPACEAVRCSYFFFLSLFPSLSTFCSNCVHQKCATLVGPWSSDQVEGAAIKIQRAYRSHRAILAFSLLEHRIKFSASQQARTTLSHLRAQAVDLGTLGALLDSEPILNQNSRVLRKAEAVTNILCRAIDRVALSEKVQRARVKWISEMNSGTTGGFDEPIAFTENDEEDSSDSDYEDLTHDVCLPKEREMVANNQADTSERLDDKPTWADVSSSGSDHSGSTEEYYEYGTGVPEDSDENVSNARRSAIISLCSGPRQKREWISQILTAPPLKKSARRASISKVPKLLTISEESELEA
ncbi:hypothetical protein ACEPAI_8908 [Sanghuangporus weigelae]